jgi:hypothetical protein
MAGAAPPRPSLVRHAWETIMRHRNRHAALLRLTLLAMLLLALIQSLGASTPVRAGDATPEAALDSAATEPVDPTPEQTVVPPEPTQTPTATAQVAVPTPAIPTGTATPSGPAGGVDAEVADVAAAATGATGVLITAIDLTNGNAPVAGVCATLLETVLGIWQDAGCTDAEGRLELNPAFRLSGATLFDIEIVLPSGYIGLDFIDLTLAEGVFREETLGLEVLPPATDTMRARDIGNDTPLGGVCWSYHAATTIYGEIGDLVIGPVCDDDNDGVTTIPDVPFGAYCIVPAPPTGYRATGDGTFCVDATGARDRTRAFAGNAAGSGTAIVTVTTAWGAPFAGVCLDATLQSGIVGDTLVASGCTGDDGVATITGLYSGDYRLTATISPTTTIEPDPIDFAIVDAAPVPLAMTIEMKTAPVRFDAVVGSGPELLPGACYAVMTAVAGKPGPTAIVPEVCDDDRDGTVELAGVPYGSACIVVTPPDGWYRPGKDYSLCHEFFGGYWTIGFIPIPKPAPPTRTPLPTSTPFPTPAPAENEPNGNLLVQTCAYTGFAFNLRLYDLCTPVGAGVRLGVVQNGVQIATIVTDNAGRAQLDLPARTQFRLTYLDGAAAGWVPGPDQETRNRYGANDAFSFSPAGGNPMWTMTVRTDSWSGWNNGAAIGGACYRIVDSDGNELLPAACDDDNDGLVVIGELPAVIEFLGAIPYRAEMVSPPPGYEPFTNPSVGLVTVDHPDTWIASFRYQPVELRVKTVDENGDPLPYWCYTHQEVFSICDTDGNGTVAFNQLQPGTLMVFTAEGYGAGYFPTTPSKSITIGSAPIQELVFTAAPYGTDRDDRADVRFTIRDTQGEVVWESDDICFSISPNSGVPAGTLCADTNGVLIFRNLPTGSYTLNLVSNAFAGCETPQSFPPQAFSVSAGDLGTTIDVPVVFRCPKPEQSDSCTAFRQPVARHVQIYLGTLTDPETGDVIDEGMELSEALSFLAADELGRWADNPVADKVNLTTLLPWTMDPEVSADWGNEPDWDGNPRGALLAQFGAHGGIVAGEPVLLGQTQVTGSVDGEIFFLVEDDPMLALYPECGPDTGTLYVSYFRMATIEVYRVDATLAASRPGPTPTATPEPACSMTAERSITAAYGALTDDHGNPIYTGLALSDHIPPGLIDAIAAGAAPDAVRGLLDDWLDPETGDDAWAFAAPEALDPNDALAAQFHAEGDDVALDDPQSAGTQEYRFTSYAWVGQNELPSGCVAAASLDLLFPVELETIVTVDYVELNAALGGAGPVGPSPSPTATRTPTPTPAAGPVETAVPAVTPTLTPVSVNALPDTGARGSGRDGGATWPLLLVGMLVVVATWVNRRARRGVGPAQ